MKSETVNLLKINYLYSLTEKELKSLVYDSKEYSETAISWKSYYSYLQSYFRKVLTNGNSTYEVKYVTKSNNRQYSVGGSIQMLQNDIRGFVVDGMTDYDMCNCHPMFAKFLCNKHNIECPELTKYCENREACWVRMNPRLEGDQLKNKGKVGVLVSMNTDAISGARWLGEFSKEMGRVKLELLELEAPQQATPGSRNPISSKFNKLLCLYEDELLKNATDDLKVCSLMFDGFLTSEEVSLARLNKLGEKYGITWTIKTPSNRLSLPVDYKAIPLDKGYSEYKKHFEETNIFVNCPHGVHRLGQTEWELQPIKVISSIYSNAPHFINPITDKKDAFIRIWLDDPERRTCETMTFCPFSKNPPRCEEDTFNTFIEFSKGASVETDFVSEYLLPLTLELCECNEILQKYLLNWIAHLIQYPEQLPEVMVVLKGCEGNGKDTLGVIITKMIGSKYTHYTDKQGEVLGKFNSSAKEKLLITLNEGTDVDAMTYVEPMKHFFCASRISIKGECDKPYMANNYARGLMNSNNVRPIQVTDSNRRFFVTRTTNKYLGNKKWFGKLYEELEKDGVGQTLFNWFYDRDISKFKVRDFPKGSLEQELKDSTVKPIARFIFEAMTNPKDGWAYNPKNNNELWVSKRKILDDLRSFCLAESYSCKMSPQRLKLELSDMSSSITPGQRSIGGCKSMCYIFDKPQVLIDVLHHNSALVEVADPDSQLEGHIIHTFGMD